jgi:hypothetical protein
MKAFVFLALMVAGLILSAPASAVACRAGYTESAGACVVVIPENASLNFEGDGCICNFGFQRYGQVCGPVIVPRNATLGRNSDVWTCNLGYYEMRACPRKKPIGRARHRPPRRT